MTSRNVIHIAFDFADSVLDSSSGPLANKSGMLCGFLRGTLTFILFSSTTGAMLFLFSATELVFALRNVDCNKRRS